ncbi:Calmodulin binding protein PICBP [Linum perenne]
MEVNEKEFSPKNPNFLPLVDEAEGVKVDLKHQMMDERRNSEEWMIDPSLQQTVTKLATARKRKVALLVEAFETVSPPLTKFEPPITHPLFSLPFKLVVD